MQEHGHGTSAELVTYAARLVRIVARAAAGDSPAAVRVLSILDELGPLTVGDLAKADRTSQPTTSSALRALEGRGLVARVAHPQDARSTLVTLTDAGHAELAAARRRNGEVVDRLLAYHDVDQQTLTRVVATLRTLTDPLPERPTGKP